MEREACNARIPSFFICSVPLQSKLFRAVVAFLWHKAMAGGGVGGDSPALDKQKQREGVQCHFSQGTKQNPTVFAALAITINSNTMIAQCGKIVGPNH